MARKKGVGRSFVVTQCVTAAAGDSDGDTTIPMWVPGDGARLVDATFESNTAGVGTGTISATLEAGLGGAGTAIAAALAGIDADAAAGTIHGTVEGNGQVTKAKGTQLQLLTAKTGTVSTGVVFGITCLWEL